MTPRGADQFAVEQLTTGQWRPPVHGQVRERILAVDPGDVHVGVAEFALYPSEPWRVTWAGEMTPPEFLEHLARYLPRSRWDRLVVEEWRLFPEHAPRAVGSDMPTSRLIGGIQALVRFLSNTPTDLGVEPIEPVMQSPQIKIPTRSWLHRRKLRSVAKMLGVTADHATDAELHGYYWLISNQKEIWNSTEQARMYAENPRLSHCHSIW